MDDPILTVEERESINAGRWFSSLSPSLRHDILRCAYVKRLKDGDLITARGDPAEEWMACAKGAVRVSSTSLSGKQITFTDRKSTRLNSSHSQQSRMPSSA